MGMTTTIERVPLTAPQLKALTANLNPKRVAQRAAPGGGKKLSYLQAWDVRTALIRIFGFAEWSAVTMDAKVISTERDIPRKKANGDEYVTAFRITCQATVKLTIHQTGAEYSATAIASQAGADIGEVGDFAMKTAESDALKRAAMNLGTQFGLSLYDNGSTNDVVQLVFAPSQLMGRADTPENRAASGAEAAATTLTPELREQTEALIAKGLQMVDARDNARVPEENQEVVAEAVPAE